SGDCFAPPSVRSRKSEQAAVVAFCPRMVIAATTSQRRPNTTTDIIEDIPGSFSVANNNSDDTSQPFHFIRRAISKNFHLYLRANKSACRRIHSFPSEFN